MICPNCGKEILDSAAFCTQCGANIAKMMSSGGMAGERPAETTPEGIVSGSGKTPDSYDPHMYDDIRPHGQHLHANESQAKLEQGYPGQEQGQSAYEQPQTGPEQSEFSSQNINETGKKPFLSVRTASLLCYWFSMIGWAASYFLSDKNDPYLRFHLNQSLVLALAALLIDFLGRVESLGTVVFALAIARFVLWVIAFVRSCKGSTDPVPLIGNIHIIN